MARVELMSWEQAQPSAGPLRFAIFVGEQNVPSGIELDDMDAQCIHAVAFDVDDKPIGTGRLLPDGHIGRMAVLKEWRGQGIGGFMLTRLMARAKERGDREVVLSAQTHAVPFYRAHGFVPRGGEYMEAGIRHQEMLRKL